MSRVVDSASIWHERIKPYVQKPFDARSPGDVDYGRVIHSASFRRLQGKTQILNLGDSDFYRNRLTHSLEVMQIAGGLAKQLVHNQPHHDANQYIPEQPMMHAIAGTHDLGHPPFGHGGEVALNYCMRDDGGFEGNGQTLRILSKLEKFSDGGGSNLTRETLLGVLKYPIPYSKALNPAASKFDSKLRPKMLDGTSGTPILDRDSAKPPKCYLDCEQDVIDWMLSSLSPSDRDLLQSFDLKENEHQSARHKSFACSIMDLADDISYGVHDLEDVLALRLVTREQFDGWSRKDSSGNRRSMAEECQGILDYLNTNYQGQYGNDIYAGFVDKLFGNGEDRKHQINRILNYIIQVLKLR
jgi:dGTPase